MAECNGNCSSCADASGCGSKGIQKLNALEGTNIKKIIAVISGKGGVGKSMTSSLLAVSLARKGYRVGLMDADITGPSIPNMFGQNSTTLEGDEEGIYPAITDVYMIKTISINMMLEDNEDPVLWRGPIVAGYATQFYSNVHWGDLDYLVIDMPPGTSDVALSVLQQLPIDSMVMVTTPSKLVSTIVAKAIKMAEKVNIPVVGIIENMSYVKCDNCGHDVKLYDESDADDLSRRYGVEILARMPLDKNLSSMADNGLIEDYEGDDFEKLIEKL